MVEGLAYLGERRRDCTSTLANDQRHQLDHAVLVEVGGPFQNRGPFGRRGAIPGRRAKQCAPKRSIDLPWSGGDDHAYLPPTVARIEDRFCRTGLLDSVNDRRCAPRLTERRG